jgi:hypothetical protein
MSSSHLQLQDFWSDTPHLWLIFVGSKFPVKGISSEANKFNVVFVSGLPNESLHQAIDVPEKSNMATPYVTLKNQLLDRI